MANHKNEISSFKDPSGYVAIENNRVFRHLTPKGQEIWKQIDASGIVSELVSSGMLIPTWVHAKDDNNEVASLEHEKIPYITYPYEWPPFLLKKAALLHLDILEKILPKGFTLKDSTPFNVQFKGPHPVFIDVLSIDPHITGDPWAGYGQFCDTMLYPLMLYYYKGIATHEWLRTPYAGITPEKISPLFGWKDLVRPGVLSHIKLRSYFHKNFQNPKQVKRTDIQKLNLPLSVILNNIKKLKKIIHSFPEIRKPESHWASYAEMNSYSQAQLEQKKIFIDQFCSEISPELVWDLGSNTGDFTQIASKNAKRVMSFDADVDAIERLAVKFSTTNQPEIIPLIMDLTNPSPSLGWACQERKSIFDRGRPDLILALALTHHLALRGNITLQMQISLFSRISKYSVIEFVEPADAMYQQMATNQAFDHATYTKEIFEATLSGHFEKLSVHALTPTRHLYLLKSLVE